MLVSTESDSEDDYADAWIGHFLDGLEPALQAAWDKDPQRYNAVLTSTLQAAAPPAAPDTEGA